MSCRRSGLASLIRTPRMPLPRGSSPIAARVLGVDPGREEPLEALPGAVDHPEGRVTGARQRRRRLDDSLEQGIERELRGERDARLDEHTKALLRRRRGVAVAGVRHPARL